MHTQPLSRIFRCLLHFFKMNDGLCICVHRKGNPFYFFWRFLFPLVFWRKGFYFYFEKYIIKWLFHLNFVSWVNPAHDSTVGTKKKCYKMFFLYMLHIMQIKDFFVALFECSHFWWRESSSLSKDNLIKKIFEKVKLFSLTRFCVQSHDKY